GDGVAVESADGGGSSDEGGAAALDDRERRIQLAEEQRHAVRTRLQYRSRQAESLLLVVADRPRGVAADGQGEPGAPADGRMGADRAWLVRQLAKSRQAVAGESAELVVAGGEFCAAGRESGADSLGQLVARRSTFSGRRGPVAWTRGGTG